MMGANHMPLQAVVVNHNTIPIKLDTTKLRRGHPMGRLRDTLLPFFFLRKLSHFISNNSSDTRENIDKKLDAS
jgi:hypothetical protein